MYKTVRTTFQEIKNDKELVKKYNDVFAEQLKQGIIEESLEDCKAGECQYLLIMPLFKKIKTLAK